MKPALLATPFALLWAVVRASILQRDDVDSNDCGVREAYSILKSVSTGDAFCSSFLYSTALEVTVTKTKTVDEKWVCLEADCLPLTLTWQSFESDSTLPTITPTFYSSTVIIPSGPSRPIDRRTATVEGRGLRTPHELSTCAQSTITSACHSLLPTPTTTFTTTFTTTSTSYRCTTTETITNLYIDHTVYSSTYTAYLYPAPDLVFEPSTVVPTITIPSVCAGPAYVATATSIPPPLGVYDLGYPYFTYSSVECCVICHKFTNCVASSYHPSAGYCQLLINGVPDFGPLGYFLPGPGGCPAGIVDYGFGPPVKQTHVDEYIYIFPGPCGK